MRDMPRLSVDIDLNPSPAGRNRWPRSMRA
ncbi:hypothetical protein [Bradyrhizobium hipponense]